jgi:hypothetical protein
MSFRWWYNGQRRRIQPRSLWCLASGRDEGYWVATSSPCLFESSHTSTTLTPALVALNLGTLVILLPPPALVSRVNLPRLMFGCQPLSP